MQLTIIGGGAAGFMAAITAAEINPDLSVLILEKNKTVLNKVRISGGGRCNVTHQPSEPRFFAKNYPRGDRFLQKLFSQFNAEDTIQWFNRRGVALKTEKDGRVFPVSNSSETIIECLVQNAAARGVRIQTSVAVESFLYQKDSSGGAKFKIELQNGDALTSDVLLIASGGRPKSENYNWLSIHHPGLLPPVPSLFTFNCPDSYLLPLSGVSVGDALVRIVGTKHSWRGPLLLTHWGFSGPAILKLSAWGARDLAESGYRFSLRVNWTPDTSEDSLRQQMLRFKTETPKQQIASHPRFGLPLRLWKAFTEKSEIPDDMRWMEAPHKLLNRLIDLLTNSQFEINGKSTFKEEFVTCGGINLDDINPATLESRLVQGLYFAGEVLDVDGITGGFNFQNAWTTGFVAGKTIAASTLSPQTTTPA